MIRMGLALAALFCASCSSHRAATHAEKLDLPGPWSTLVAIPDCHPSIEDPLCLDTPRPEPPPIPEADLARCKELGGYVDSVSFNTDGCVVPTKDVGNICHDSQECTGACLAPEDISEGQPTSGKCAATVGMFFGCWNIVKNGAATGTICH